MPVGVPVRDLHSSAFMQLFCDYQISMNATLAWTTVMPVLCASILFQVFLALVSQATSEME